MNRKAFSFSFFLIFKLLRSHLTKLDKCMPIFCYNHIMCDLQHAIILFGAHLIQYNCDCMTWEYA